MRAALYLAGQRKGRLIPIRRISDDLGMPYHFLAKIAQTLIGAGMLISERGPRGGVALARPPGDITLEQIVLAVDGPAIFEECVLGLPECGIQRPCPLHAAWATAREQVERMFRLATLEDMAARIAEGDVRLSDVTRARPEAGRVGP